MVNNRGNEEKIKTFIDDDIELRSGNISRDNNKFYYWVKSPRTTMIVEENCHGETQELNEDCIIIKVDEENNNLVIEEKNFEGFRKSDGERVNDLDSCTTEYIVEKTLKKTYSVIEENGEKFLECKVTRHDYSFGEHDNYGGEKGNGFSSDETVVSTTKIAVSSDYKITDGRPEKAYTKLK